MIRTWGLVRQDRNDGLPVEDGRVVIAVRCLTAVIASIILMDALFLFHVRVPLGVDGYYYAEQVKSYNVNGFFSYAIRGGYWLYFIAIIAKFTGPIIAPKVSVIVVDVLMSMSVSALAYALFAKLSAAVVGPIVLHATGLYSYLIVEYQNQFASEAFCVSALCFATLILCPTRQKQTIIVGSVIVLTLATIATHRDGRWLIGLIAAAYLVSRFKTQSVRLLLILSGMGLFALVLSRISPEDVNSQRHTWLSFMFLPRLLATASLLYARESGVPMARTAAWRSAATIVAWIAFNPLVSFDRGMDGIPGRLLLILPPIIAVFGSYALIEVLKKREPVLVVMFIVGFWGCTAYVHPFGSTKGFLEARRHLAFALSTSALSEKTTYIARHGDEFLFTFYTAQPASHDAITIQGPRTWLIDWPAIAPPAVEGRPIYETQRYVRILMTDRQVSSNLQRLDARSRNLLLQRNGPLRRYLQSSHGSGDSLEEQREPIA